MRDYAIRYFRRGHVRSPFLVIMNVIIAAPLLSSCGYRYYGVAVLEQALRIREQKEKNAATMVEQNVLYLCNQSRNENKYERM
jgi:hypothetical protein